MLLAADQRLRILAIARERMWPLANARKEESRSFKSVYKSVIAGEQEKSWRYIHWLRKLFAYELRLS